MKRTLISGAVLALAVSGMGVAQAEKPQQAGTNNGGFKVTGGGQIVADGAGRGAGDTVGFNAQEIAGDDAASDAPDDAARGQFQFVPRGQSNNASAPQQKFHGVVTCLISGSEAVRNEQNENDGNVEEALQAGSARFGGFLRDNPSQAFTVDVTDNGQGSRASGEDMILVRLTAEPCADNPEDERGQAEKMLKLGRGNVKIHNNPDGASSALANAKMAAAFAGMLR